MKKSIQKLATQALKYFVTKTRDNGKEFVSCKNNRPEWLKTLCWTAHDGMMPDDYKYQFIQESLEAIANTDESDDLDDLRLEADIYTADLLNWLASNLTRVEYMTQAIQEMGAKTGSDALTWAQYLEKEEVLRSVTDSLRKQLKN